jgi:hypothetical protein
MQPPVHSKSNLPAQPEKRRRGDFDMLKYLTLAILGAALFSLSACAHHEEQQQTTSTSSTGYTK